MAGLGRKEWSPGDTLTAADVNGYLMDQSVMVFAGTAARASAIPTPSAGMVAYSTATSLNVYHDAAWQSISGGVVQVKSTTVTASTFSTISSSFVDITGLSVSITPTSASNKILVMATVQGGLDLDVEIFTFALARGGTSIGGGVTGTCVGEGRAASRAYSFSMQFLDSPASTSALTYNVRTKTSGGYSFYLNRRGSSDAYNGISTITVMEVTP
jgi:hypothetical protein